MSATCGEGHIPSDHAEETTEERLRRAVREFFRPRRPVRSLRERALLATGTPLRLAGDLAATAWGSGPPVLLVHGWEGRGTQFGAFIAPLVAAGRRVVAVDLPAHGDSPGDAVSVWDVARRSLAIGREIGPLDGVVGHSFGALGLAIALANGLVARRAALIASPRGPERVADGYADAIGLTPPERTRFWELLVERVGVAVERLIAPNLPPPDVPILLLHDPEDAVVPYAEAVAIAAAWPNVLLRAVAGRDHQRILRADVVVRETVAFLTA